MPSNQDHPCAGASGGSREEAARGGGRVLLPLPPQEQPDWGCGQSPEFRDPRSGGEWGFSLVLWVVVLWLSPRGCPQGVPGPSLSSKVKWMVSLGDVDLASREQACCICLTLPFDCAPRGQRPAGLAYQCPQHLAQKHMLSKW